MINCSLCLFPVLTEFFYVIAALNLAYPISPWRFKLFCAPPNTTDNSPFSPAGIPKNASALSGGYEAVFEANLNASSVYISELSKTIFHCCFGNDRGKNCSVLAGNTEGKSLASMAKALIFHQLGKYFRVPVYTVVFCLYSSKCFNSLKLVWIRYTIM